MTTKTYTLKRPIPVKPDDDSAMLTELTLNDDPDCGDLAASDAVEGGMHKTIALIAALCGITYATAKRLKPVDFVALNEIIMPIVNGAEGNG
jgi:hypothetical protein